MIKSKVWLAVSIGFLAWAGMGFGEEGGVKLTPSGFGSYEVGQIIKANPLTTRDAAFYQSEHLLFQKAFIGFNLQASYDPLPITTNISAELKSFTETPRTKAVANNLGVGVRLFYFLYLTRADFNYTHGPAFNLDVGYFPIKYNDDARNLGEYLFRSGTYPQFLITNFDFAAARVAGVNAYGALLDNLNYKALLTVNTENATMGDLNLTGIASYSIFDKLLDFGAGVSFCSLISSNTEHTRPTKEIMKNRTDWYVENGDTLTYTFAGTKLMARMSIDPKPLIQSELFGKEDLKVYAEAAILGVKNYPVSMGQDSIIDTSNLATRYDDITRRMPIMFGFNFPAFKFLDVLSMQAEYFGSRYPNDMKNYVVYGSPAALSAQWNGGNGQSSYADSLRDNWKWSIYAKKTFAGRFFIVGQFASDHLRWDAFSYADQAYMLTEALTQTQHNYFVLKLGFSF